jgi:hypothetical protein
MVFVTHVNAIKQRITTLLDVLNLCAPIKGRIFMQTLVGINLLSGLLRLVGGIYQASFIDLKLCSESNDAAFPIYHVMLGKLKKKNKIIIRN